MDIWGKLVNEFAILCIYVGMHQVRMLVFVNYQMCTAPLKNQPCSLTKSKNPLYDQCSVLPARKCPGMYKVALFVSKGYIMLITIAFYSCKENYS